MLMFRQLALRFPRAMLVQQRGLCVHVKAGAGQQMPGKACLTVRSAASHASVRCNAQQRPHVQPHRPVQRTGVIGRPPGTAPYRPFKRPTPPVSPTPQPFNGGYGTSQPQVQVAPPVPDAAGQLTASVERIIHTDEQSDGKFFYIVSVNVHSLEGVSDDFLSSRPVVTGHSYSPMRRGMQINCDVSVVDHPQHGKQLRTKLFCEVRPDVDSDPQWIAALASMGIDGIGVANATKIVEHLGAAGISKLTTEEPDVIVKRLMKVPGIGKKKATAVAENKSFRNGERAEALGKLQLAGISAVHAHELFNRYPGRSQAYDLLLKDPYFVCWHLGISLKIADVVAMKLNFQRDRSVLRGWMALRDAQKDVTRQSGNTCSSLLKILHEAQARLAAPASPQGNAEAMALQASVLAHLGMKYDVDGALTSISPGESFFISGDRVADAQEADTLFVTHSAGGRMSVKPAPKPYGSIWFPLKVVIPIGEQASPGLAEMRVTSDSADVEQGLTVVAQANASGRRFVKYCDAAAVAAAREASGSTLQAFPWAQALSYSHPLWESESSIVDILTQRLEESAHEVGCSTSGSSAAESLDDGLHRQNSALHRIFSHLADRASLSQGQREAVLTALTYPVVVVTGGPGCGKTETLRTLKALLAQSLQAVDAPLGCDAVRMAGCAPTGRAAARLGDAMGNRSDAHTIHRLARLHPQRSGVVWVKGSEEWENDILELLDMVAVDELSMVSVNLFSRFLTRYLDFDYFPEMLDKEKLPNKMNGPHETSTFEGIVSRHRSRRWRTDEEDSESWDEYEYYDDNELELEPSESLSFRDLGLPPGKRLLLVGDPDQLPSIEAGLVLRDLIESGVVPVIDLRLIFRQAADSDIIKAAFAIKQGQCPVLPQLPISDLEQPVGGPSSQPPWGADNAFLVPAADRASSERAIQKLLEHLKLQGFDMLQDVQVVTPYRKPSVELSVPNLNPFLQDLLNPKSPEDTEINVPQWGKLRAGTKVLQTKNVYDDDSADVFNGDVGLVKGVKYVKREKKVIVEGSLGPKKRGRALNIATTTEIVPVAVIEFVRGSRHQQHTFSKVYDMEELVELTQMGWATTVHKMQGCEARVVIMVASDLHFGNNPWSRNSFFTKELLYTGITRARDLLFIVGSQRAVEKMVALQSVRRTSILSDRLFFAAQRAGLPLHPLKRFGNSP